MPFSFHSGGWRPPRHGGSIASYLQQQITTCGPAQDPAIPSTLIVVSRDQDPLSPEICNSNLPRLRRDICPFRVTTRTPRSFRRRRGSDDFVLICLEDASEHRFEGAQFLRRES